MKGSYETLNKSSRQRGKNGMNVFLSFSLSSVHLEMCEGVLKRQGRTQRNIHLQNTISSHCKEVVSIEGTTTFCSTVSRKTKQQSVQDEALE